MGPLGLQQISNMARRAGAAMRLCTAYVHLGRQQMAWLPALSCDTRLIWPLLLQCVIALVQQGLFHRTYPCLQTLPAAIYSMPGLALKALTWGRRRGHSSRLQAHAPQSGRNVLRDGSPQVAIAASPASIHHKWPQDGPLHATCSHCKHSRSEPADQKHLCVVLHQACSHKTRLDRVPHDRVAEVDFLAPA